LLLARWLVVGCCFAAATALWCGGGGIGREIEPPQLRISSYPSSWNKLLTSTFGSLSNFSFIPTFPQHGALHTTTQHTHTHSLYMLLKDVVTRRH
jgi:hypothetical protein